MCYNLFIMKNHEENKNNNNLELLEGTSPEIQDFFARYGPEALEVYVSTRLFHATHSANLDAIATEGLRDTSGTIDEDDLAFLQNAFVRSGGSEDLGDRERFDHYIMGKGYDGESQSPRGIYLSSVVEGMDRPPDGLLENRSYGVSERLAFFIQNLNQIANGGGGLDSVTREQAASMRDRYIDKLLDDNPAIILLEINPLAPEVINERLSAIHLHDLSDPELRRNTLRFANSGDVHLLGPIKPEHLAIADAARLDDDALRNRLLSSPEMNFFRQKPD